MPEACHKTVVITGCSSGFGRLAAHHLARHGWLVFATVRKQADQRALLTEAGSQRHRQCLHVVQCDITSAGDIERLRQAVSAQTHVLDALINNAGTGFPAPLELLPLDDLRAQFEVNLVGHLAVTQALLPALKAARGTIINVSSIGGRIAYPVNGAYHLSKFALEALSDSLRVELAPFGVKVVVVEPGSSPTGIWETSLQRGGELELTIDTQAYAPLVKAVRAAARSNLALGFPPQQFAEVVRRILENPNPAPRYAIPFWVGWIIALRRWLPDRLWDYGVRRVLRW
jgi:NAD(P)-dependent dehydrogenase (short-subunit alcohol dehydrogenase family)